MKVAIVINPIDETAFSKALGEAGFVRESIRREIPGIPSCFFTGMPVYTSEKVTKGEYWYGLEEKILEAIK